MVKQQKESEEIKKLRKELTKLFNQKIDNIRCFVDQKISSLQNQIEESKKLLSVNEGGNAKSEILKEIGRCAQYCEGERRILKKKAVVNDFKIDCCTETNEELIEVNRCMCERVEQLTDEVKKLSQKQYDHEREKEKMREEFQKTKDECRKEKNELWNTVEELREENDSLHQYGRRETLIIHNVPQKANEDTTQVALQFLWTNLGMNINRQFVSTCHRNYPPKNTYPVNCPPIYVKFVIRDIKKECLKRKSRLRGRCNANGHQLQISESLTLFRKNLLSDIKTELSHWKYFWTREGNIWGRRDENSRAVKINTYRVLDDG